MCSEQCVLNRNCTNLFYLCVGTCICGLLLSFSFFFVAFTVLCFYLTLQVVHFVLKLWLFYCGRLIVL